MGEIAGGGGGVLSIIYANNGKWHKILYSDKGKPSSLVI